MNRKGVTMWNPDVEDELREIREAAANIVSELLRRTRDQRP